VVVDGDLGERRLECPACGAAFAPPTLAALGVRLVEGACPKCGEHYPWRLTEPSGGTQDAR
jgi:ribosomal protein S27AE